MFLAPWYGTLFEIARVSSASVVLAFSQIWQGQPFFLFFSVMV
jgi:hypothetical protein